jgi:hypothetical protein
MPLLKITTPGLVAIACSVALLWTCIFSERTMLNRVYAERTAVMRSLARRRHAQQVRTPGLPKAFLRHSVAG